MELTLSEAIAVWRNPRAHPKTEVDRAYTLLFNHLVVLGRGEPALRNRDLVEDTAQTILLRLTTAKPRAPGAVRDEDDEAVGDPDPEKRAKAYLRRCVANMAIDAARRGKRQGKPVDVADPVIEQQVNSSLDKQPTTDLAASGEEADTSFDAWVGEQVAARNAARNGIGDNLRDALDLLLQHKREERDPPPTGNQLRVAARHREWLVEQLWGRCAGAAAHADFYLRRYGEPPVRGAPPPRGERFEGDSSSTVRLRRLQTCAAETRLGRLPAGDTSEACARADVWRLILRERYCLYEGREPALSEQAAPHRPTSKRT